MFVFTFCNFYVSVLSFCFLFLIICLSCYVFHLRATVVYLLELTTSVDSLHCLPPVLAHKRPKLVMLGEKYRGSEVNLCLSQ